jgi:hypothetical protein
MTNRFDDMIQSYLGIADKNYLEAATFVADLTFLAWLWWDDKHPEMKATPADLIAMVSLMQQHHHWLAERQDHDNDQR